MNWSKGIGLVLAFSQRLIDLVDPRRFGCPRYMRWDSLLSLLLVIVADDLKKKSIVLVFVEYL